MSASELAELIGASRVTARRYLEHLADSGLLERDTRFGRTGRPEVEYAGANRADHDQAQSVAVCKHLVGNPEFTSRPSPDVRAAGAVWVKLLESDYPNAAVQSLGP